LCNRLRSAAIIQGCGTGAPERGILPGAGTQIKNQELEAELCLNSRTGAVAMAILELWPPAPGSFLDTKGFAK